MVKTKLDKILIGILIGLIGAAIGITVYAFSVTSLKGQSFSHFMSHVFPNFIVIQRKTITLGLFLNVGVFFLLLKMNMLKAAKGILITFFIVGAYILYLKFFT